MQDGIAYILNLRRLLEQSDMPKPEGLILTGEMFSQIEHSYPGLVIDHEYVHDFSKGLVKGKATAMKFYGFKIYRGKE